MANNQPKSRSSRIDPNSGAKHTSFTIDGETLPLRIENETLDYDTIDALFRLLVGGSAELTDLLVSQLEQWQTDVLSRPNAKIIEEEEDVGDIVRYLLIGVAFESQRQVRSSATTVGSWLLKSVGTSVSLARPITQSRLFSPIRKSADAVAGRVETRIGELVSTGRSEEFVGRLVADEALLETYDWAIDYFAQNPEIRELVTEQAMGFTEEFTIGARERAITSDNIVENLLRRLLRRTPRADLPGPPAIIQQQAIVAQQPEQKKTE